MRSQVTATAVESYKKFVGDLPNATELRTTAKRALNLAVGERPAESICTRQIHVRGIQRGIDMTSSVGVCNVQNYLSPAKLVPEVVLKNRVIPPFDEGN
jgi:hypothetical protein